ncbi:unnamed protein product [Pleuronectes platessa]|uniref:Uncharacterized protein n=1 Tax=Pleuronectes platessa TaxID=8262 RepID=A0A9N7UWI8_PLEPL|nr:unnamed protein product [Pleuronectes platessa]
MSLADVHWYLWLNRWARAAAGGTVAPSPSSPRRRRLGVWPASTFFGGEVLVRWRLRASLVRGAFFLLDHGAVSIGGAEGRPLEGTGYGGRQRRLWTSVGPFSRITSESGSPRRGSPTRRRVPPAGASAGA